MQEFDNKYDAFFAAVTNIRKVIVSKNYDNLEEAFEQVFSATRELVIASSCYSFMQLNTNTFEQDWLSNGISKLLLTIQFISNNNGYTPEAQRSITFSALFLFIASASKIQSDIKLNRLDHLNRKGYKKEFEQAFELSKRIKFANHLSIRLLSQIANKNKYNNTNLDTLAMLLLCFYSSVSVLINKTTIKHALANQNEAMFKDKYRCSTKDIDIQELLVGNVTRLSKKRLGLLVSPDLFNNKWMVFIFSENKLNTQGHFKLVKQKEVLQLYPQQKINTKVITEIVEQYQSQFQHGLNFPQPIKAKKTKERYQAKLNWNETAKLLTLGNNKKIASYINQNFILKEFVLSHAAHSNRAHNKVTSTEHAIAMVGSERLFPLICNGEVTFLASTLNYIGVKSVNQSAERFAQINLIFAKELGLELPEYNEFLGRVLALSVFSIPKVEFALTSPFNCNQLAFEQLHLGKIYHFDSPLNWQKLSLYLVQSWKIPKKYQAAVNAYFDYINNPSVLTRLPRSQQQLVLIIKLSTLAFANILLGNRLPMGIETVKQDLKLLNLTARNFNQLYLSAINQLNPFTPLN